MRLRATLTGLLLLTSLPAAAQEIILVRHAEKGTEADPGLTPDGQVRAQALAALLKPTPPVMILTSPARRTQETAAPVAAQAGVTPEVVPIPPGDMPPHIRMTAEKLAALKPGQVALVVGHSNTVPAIIKAVGGPAVPDLPECAFGRLYRWDVAEKTLRIERYGAESNCPLAE
ncbi:MAG: SixA phosphatase family protein [Niveispirillum sp.]|uniref:SixA phosphatase family protein n=1 Tax=Niveispirillum sp. TaxID=1917217 RepID=UPI003BA78563